MYNDTILIKYQHSAEIRVKFGELQTVMDWCDENCVGPWWFQDPDWSSDYAEWKFSFGNERDCLLFVLKWN